MGREDTKDLLEFLQPFDQHTVELAMWLREFVWKLYPKCNELIYDNYNAVAIGWAPTLKLNDIFCSIAVYSNKSVNFGFYWGSRLDDPQKMLLGKGKQYRFIRVESKKDFPKEYIKELLAEAHMNSLAGVKNLESVPRGETLVKSITTKKRRPVKKKEM
jgi:hypothetical protein